MSADSICVWDFCGTAKFLGYSEPVSMWADYWPKEGLTRFGGAWHDVPDLKTALKPADEEILAHVAQHSEWERKAKARHERDCALEKSLA